MSTGDNFEELFANCKATLAKELDAAMVVGKDEPNAFHIEMKGDFQFGKRKFSQLFFAAVQRNRASVVFHFMPVYMNEPLKESLSPVLMKRLKGKACFHLQKWDKEIESAIEDALVKGRASYESFGPKEAGDSSC